LTADPSLWFLLIKMLATAGIVVSASLIAERTGPLFAAMVATLPVSAGPVYFFLALDHGDAFIATAAVGSMGSNTATAAFSLIYVLAAQRLGVAASLGLAFSGWCLMLLVFKTVEPSFAALLGVTLLAFPLMHAVAKPYLAAKPLTPPRLAWYAIPLRALFVSVLVAAVTTLSFRIGPQWSGYFATLPVVLSTLVIFVHPRIGGPATAAIIGSGLLGLMGFGVALAVAHLTAVPLGKWSALGLGLAVCVVWNLMLLGVSRLSRPKASPAAASG
jgi:hypothetical protein